MSIIKNPDGSVTYTYSGGRNTVPKGVKADTTDYSKYDPATALDQWFKNGGGDMSALAATNPAAWQLVSTGVDNPDDGGKTLKVFNPETGQWDTQEKKGYWSHPESWIQLAAGAGLGATALGAFGNASVFGGGGAAPGAANTIEGIPVTGSVAPAVTPPVTGATTGLASKLLTGNIVPTITSVFGGLLGTKMQNDAAQKAADEQAAAYKYAADLQDAANKRAEQFSREQAENQYQNTEASRLGNYNQWAAREGRVSNLGQALGLSARNIPGYVPGVDPRYTSSSSSSSTSGGLPPPPTFNPNATADVSGYNDDVSKAVAQNYASLGTKPTGPGSGPTDLAYFAQRINQTGGLTPENQAYWFGPNGRIAKELAGAVPPEPTSNAPTNPALPGSLGSVLSRPLTTSFWWS
jgi:hypothetical protein